MAVCSNCHIKVVETPDQTWQRSTTQSLSSVHMCIECVDQKLQPATAQTINDRGKGDPRIQVRNPHQYRKPPSLLQPIPRNIESRKEIAMEHLSRMKISKEMLASWRDPNRRESFDGSRSSGSSSIPSRRASLADEPSPAILQRKSLHPCDDEDDEYRPIVMDDYSPLDMLVQPKPDWFHRSLHLSKDSQITATTEGSSVPAALLDQADVLSSDNEGNGNNDDDDGSDVLDLAMQPVYIPTARMGGGPKASTKMDLVMDCLISNQVRADAAEDDQFSMDLAFQPLHISSKSRKLRHEDPTAAMRECLAANQRRTRKMSQSGSSIRSGSTDSM
ncbi:hypothetical protein AeRB84_010130 [Aphanomyces euteiches]|nr:hypothetical protein AeRB84_010130 [Aphanomyces euteiches]